MYDRDPVYESLARYGPPDVLLMSPWFWIVLLAMYSITGGAAMLFRTAMWVTAPQDSMIVAEMEAKVCALVLLFAHTYMHARTHRGVCRPRLCRWWRTRALLRWWAPWHLVAHPKCILQVWVGAIDC